MKEITVTLRADDFTEYCHALGYNITADKVEQLFEILEAPIKFVMLVHAETFLINTIDPSREREGK